MSAVLQQPTDVAVAASQVVVIPTEPKEVAFHFKKEKIKDSEGKILGEGKKLPSVKLNVPRVSAEGVLNIVAAGGKQLALLQEAIADVQDGQIREELNRIREANAKAGTPDKEIKPEEVNLAVTDWNVIANLPPAQRRGLGISDEDWEQFFTDYKAIMPKATGKDMDRIEKHVGIYKRRFQTVRNDKKALQVLGDNLQIWAANTGAMEDNTTVYEYLKDRIATLLQEEEKVLAEAL